MKRGVVARAAAAVVLQRVLDDGGHSNIIINAARGDLTQEDAAQMQRIVLATIRHLVALDGLLENATKRSIETLDPEVRAVLRAGAAELLVDQGDPYGVVDSAVEATRYLGRPQATGLVNATLRRLVREEPKLGTGTLAPWILERLADQFGEAEAADAVAALDQPVGRGVRIRPGARLGRHERVAGIAQAAYLPPGVTFPKGGVDFIDPASTAVAVAAAVEPGMTVLDVAAAPGGKTAALWDAMSGEGTLVAADSHQGRIGRARRRLGRMDMTPYWVVADGVNPPFAPATFDLVLLDAPCTGLGTLRRRPEIRHRLGADDPSRLGKLQRSMLDASLGLVKAGGRLVYAACTLFSEETVDVVAGYSAAAPVGIPGKKLDGGVLLAPHITGTDGMFISVIER